MISLDPRAVRLGATAVDKTDAIRQVGQILVDTGFIEPGYVASLLARERVANTFLGNGIAIPHGVPKDRGLIKKTGVAVLQVPDGVEWNPGDRVHLVVGIAAKSDEHLQILTNLTDVLGNADEAARLAHTADPADIARRLSAGPSLAAGAAAYRCPRTCPITSTRSSRVLTVCMRGLPRRWWTSPRPSPRPSGFATATVPAMPRA